MKKTENSPPVTEAPEQDVAVSQTKLEAPPDKQVKPEQTKLPVVDPFSKRVAIEDVFKHQQVSELQEMIRAAIAQSSMVLVSGPPGVGKTTGVRCVTDELPPNKFIIIYLGQDQHGVNLLSRFSAGLGLSRKRYRQPIVMQLSEWLANNVQDNGKAVVLIIDEAHLLDDRTLEELRLLSNADYDRQSSFTLIMIAQPWLRARLKSPFFEPLYQRIRYRYSLEGLSKEDTIDYVRARLSAAGLSEALQQIFAHSEGIPRKVNNLCSHLLLKANSGGLTEIDAALVRTVIDAMDI
jgi:type II secretory pathway predicted ATPase ExeA